jgi:hypothetical protein
LVRPIGVDIVRLTPWHVSCSHRQSQTEAAAKPPHQEKYQMTIKSIFKTLSVLVVAITFSLVAGSSAKAGIGIPNGLYWNGLYWNGLYWNGLYWNGLSSSTAGKAGSVSPLLMAGIDPTQALSVSIKSK